MRPEILTSGREESGDGRGTLGDELGGGKLVQLPGTETQTRAERYLIVIDGHVG